MKKLIHLLAAAVLFAALFAGCSIRKTASVKPAPVVKNPVRLAIFSDVTGSWRTSQSEHLSVEDLNPAIELLCKVGGEMAVGLVSDASDRGLIRLLVESAAAAPTARCVTTAARPATSTATG